MKSEIKLELKQYITGSDLRKMRHEAKLTTVKMAKIAGVKTRKTYENWEKNIGAPSINQYISMVIGCNLKPHTVINDFVDC
jgi:DNA-binding XRE family transcriptional regulator